MKIGDEIYVHGFVDEIRKDVVIIKNEGGYFGTVPGEIKKQTGYQKGYEKGYFAAYDRAYEDAKATMLKVIDRYAEKAKGEPDDNT